MMTSFPSGDAHDKKDLFCNCRWCHPNLVEEGQDLIHGRALVKIRCRHPELDYQFHSHGVVGYDVDVWTGPKGIGHDTEELKGWLSSWKENLSRELARKAAKTLIATEKDLLNKPAVRMHSKLIYRPGIRPKVVRVLEAKYVRDLHAHLYPSCHCMDPVYAISPSKHRKWDSESGEITPTWRERLGSMRDKGGGHKASLVNNEGYTSTAVPLQRAWSLRDVHAIRTNR